MRLAATRTNSASSDSSTCPYHAHPSAAAVIGRGTSTHAECFWTGKGTVRGRGAAPGGAPQNDSGCHCILTHTWHVELPRGHSVLKRFEKQEEETAKVPAEVEAGVGTTCSSPAVMQSTPSFSDRSWCVLQEEFCRCDTNPDPTRFLMKNTTHYSRDVRERTKT